MSTGHMAGFGSPFLHDPTPTAEVERLEALHQPLADAVRDLVELTLDPALDAGLLAQAGAAVEEVTARLRAAQMPGSFGIRHNDERSWSWGNVAIGQRNALAVPILTRHGGPGAPYVECVLGARHQGDPGLVHPGVSAMLLDHLMGETASGFRRVTMTGTLTMRHREPLPLGPVRLEARVTSEEGRKVVVDAALGRAGADGTIATVCVESTGLFIVPRWAS